MLGLELPWMDGLQRPAYAKRIPSVLTVAEVRAVLDAMAGPAALVARLLYGTGMRLMEGLRLCVKDVDFDRMLIVVREAKGNKDRVVMLPASLREALRQQVASARRLWEQDRADQAHGIDVPFALERKYPDIGKTWGWFWVFPSPAPSTDPRSRIEQRHHLHEERLQRALNARYGRPRLPSGPAARPSSWSMGTRG